MLTKRVDNSQLFLYNSFYKGTIVEGLPMKLELKDGMTRALTDNELKVAQENFLCTSKKLTKY